MSSRAHKRTLVFLKPKVCHFPTVPAAKPYNKLQNKVRVIALSFIE